MSFDSKNDGFNGFGDNSDWDDWGAIPNVEDTVATVAKDDNAEFFAQYAQTSGNPLSVAEENKTDVAVNEFTDTEQNNETELQAIQTDTNDNHKENNDFFSDFGNNNDDFDFGNIANVEDDLPVTQSNTTPKPIEENIAAIEPATNDDNGGEVFKANVPVEQNEIVMRMSGVARTTVDIAADEETQENEDDTFVFAQYGNSFVEKMQQTVEFHISPEDPEQQKRTLTMIIDDTEFLVKDIYAAKEEADKRPRKKQRAYKNEAVFEKTVFATPKDINGNPVKKIIMFLLVCCAVGGFFAVQANSYFNFKGGRVQSEMACAFSWLMEENMPISLSPFNTSVAGIAFLMGFGILGIIGLFIYLDNEQKKLSRVGHEHGNARLGTPNDFKTFKAKFMENNDNNMLFGVYQNQELGLSLNNKKVNRSANVLVIGGTGTGKTFKYIKPNLLQENCSTIVTDPSGDIFRSFAPYLLSKGYNVYLFNASDFTMSNHYNPLLNVYNSYGEIDETQVDILVDLYMKNAKAGKEAGGGDPFWDKSEKAFLTAIIYYVLENEDYKEKRCFSTILELVQKAKVDDESEEDSPLTTEMNAWFRKMDMAGKPYKAKMYYDTFLIAPQKTANTILITTAVDLQIFATKEVAHITQENPIKEMNIDINKMATQQSYLFLGIPQSHQAYNFLIAMLYSQLYGRLYELGERKLRGKWHIGYKVGTPVFDYFDSEEEAKEFFETVSEEDIIESPYINDTKVYNIMFKGRAMKTSILEEPLKTLIKDIDKMYIWCGDKFAGGDPSLPIHVNFLLDEFKNIGEIPNFLTILSTSRKYRIGSHIVIQDVGQLKTMYKDGEHETVLANVDTTVFLGSILADDKEVVQKMLGKTTIRQKSTSSSNSGLSTSYTPTEVDLMSIDEISAINQNGRDDEIVIIRDVTPYLCRKLNLTHHKRWKDVKAADDMNIDLKRYYQDQSRVRQ